jgi:hypothetical protein
MFFDFLEFEAHYGAKNMLGILPEPEKVRRGRFGVCAPLDHMDRAGPTIFPRCRKSEWEDMPLYGTG